MRLPRRHGGRRPEPADPYLELEPCFIAEVTSPGTTDKDQRTKRAAYQAIPTLQTYQLVDQDRHWVARHYHDEHGGWMHATVIGDSTAAVPCPETELSLAAIYEGV